MKFILSEKPVVNYYMRNESENRLVPITGIKSKKSCPKLRIENDLASKLSLAGYIKIMGFCVDKVSDSNGRYRLHPNKLVGSNCSNGVFALELSNYRYGQDIRFENVSILHITKEQQTDILENVFKEIQFCDDVLYDPEYKLNLNQVRLYFKAYVQIDHDFIPLNSIVSDTIYNGSHDIEIVKISSLEDDACGGKEIFIFIKNLRSEKDKKFCVRFFNNYWKLNVLHDSENILQHYQTAFALKVPPFENQNIEEPVEVSLQLYISEDAEKEIDKCVSEIQTFSYLPNKIKSYENKLTNPCISLTKTRKRKVTMGAKKSTPVVQKIKKTKISHQESNEIVVINLTNANISEVTQNASLKTANSLDQAVNIENEMQGSQNTSLFNESINLIETAKSENSIEALIEFDLDNNFEDFNFDIFNHLPPEDF